MEFLKTKKSFLFRGTKFFETNDNLSVDIDDIDDFKYAEYCISKISS